MRILFIALAVCLTLGLMGCRMSQPYVMTMDRTDQELSSGNRGYIKGTPPSPKERGELKRPFVAVDIDLPDIAEGQTHFVVGKNAAAAGAAQGDLSAPPKSEEKKIQAKEAQIK